jgi:hypothetical protein
MRRSNTITEYREYVIETNGDYNYRVEVKINQTHEDATRDTPSYTDRTYMILQSWAITDQGREFVCLLPYELYEELEDLVNNDEL